MELHERVDRFDDVGREQPHERRHDPRELRVASAEVTWPVELLEKEARRSPETLAGEQVGIAPSKALLLIGFHGVDAMAERRIRLADCTLRVDTTQLREDRFGARTHRPHSSVVSTDR